MKPITLKNLAGGALQEQFDKSFEKVIENLQNPNTPYKTSREIVIKMKFVQNEARSDVSCELQISEKLAPQSPTKTQFAIGKNLETGDVFAEEYGKQIKGQMSMEDEYDEEETEGKQVIDLRKAAY